MQFGDVRVGSLVIGQLDHAMGGCGAGRHFGNGKFKPIRDLYTRPMFCTSYRISDGLCLNLKNIVNENPPCAGINLGLYSDRFI